MSPEMKAQQEALIQQYEKESKTRSFDGFLLSQIVYWLSIAIAFYHFITSFIGYPATHLHRSAHVAMMLFMAFFLYPASSKGEIGRASCRERV